MNKVCLLGRLTKDPDYRTGGSKNVANFTLVVDRYKSSADFVRCVAFGKTADNLWKYVKKGMQIAVEGNIKTGSYTTDSGQTRFTTDVWVEKFHFISRPNKALDEKPEDKPEEEFQNIADALDDENLPFN